MGHHKLGGMRRAGFEGGTHLWCSWGFAGLGGAHCGLADGLAWFPARNQDHMLWKTVRKGRPRKQTKPQKTSKPNHRQSEQQQPTATDKARRPRWAGQEGAAGNWSPCSNLLWQSTAKSFLWLGVKILSAHISTFLSASSSLTPSPLATLASSEFSQMRPCLVPHPLEDLCHCFFPGALAKSLPPSPAACEKPLQPSRHSSNVTSFTKLSLILHKPQSILLIHPLWPLFNK